MVCGTFVHFVHWFQWTGRPTTTASPWTPVCRDCVAQYALELLYGLDTGELSAECSRKDCKHG